MPLLELLLNFKQYCEETLVSLNHNVSGVFTGILYKYGDICSADSLLKESEGG